MNTANDVRVLVDDLAGHWTEPILQSLKAAGIRHVSVGMELDTWQTLKELLKSELRRQQAFRLLTHVSLSKFMEHVLRRAAVLVVEKFEPESVTSEFNTRIQQSTNDRPSTAAERRLYAKIIGQAELCDANAGIGPRWLTLPPPDGAIGSKKSRPYNYKEHFSSEPTS